MGLDMYLKARKYVSNYSFATPPDKEMFAKLLEMTGLVQDDVGPEGKSCEVEFPVAYWRKANQIHAWFVKNCAEGVDNCMPVYVGMEQLEELVKVCRDVLAAPSMAKEFLPPQEGFFFGDTDIDEGYIADLNDTIEQIDRILLNPKFKDWEFMYQASW